ncbi:MAG: diphthine synthase, partial [Candidatus Bathyarchaeia archaeon]
SGLQNYRFGASFTVPSSSASLPDSLYDVAKDNLSRGLHTFIFLDVGCEGEAGMTIGDAVNRLLKAEGRRGESVFPHDRLAVGLARLGSDMPVVKADLLERLARHGFGDVPHCLILPGRLHFMEVEALRSFAGAPEEALMRAAQG